MSAIYGPFAGMGVSTKSQWDLGAAHLGVSHPQSGIRVGVSFCFPVESITKGDFSSSISGKIRALAPRKPQSPERLSVIVVLLFFFSSGGFYGETTGSWGVPTKRRTHLAAHLQAPGPTGIAP